MSSRALKTLPSRQCGKTLLEFRGGNFIVSSINELSYIDDGTGELIISYELVCKMITTPKGAN